MKALLISSVLAFSASGAFAEGTTLDPTAAAIFELDRVSMARDLNCMQAKMECAGIDGLIGQSPDRTAAGVAASHACLKQYLDCMRKSLTQTANDLSAIKMPSN